MPSVRGVVEKWGPLLAGLLILIYGAGWAFEVIGLISSPYPLEYRDLATVQLTDLFAKGLNPYSPANSPPFFYDYGFLFSLIASIPARLCRCDLFLLHKVLIVLCIFGAAFLVSLEVKKYTKSNLLQVLGFALMLASSWNTAAFIIRPDSLGLLLVVAIAFILSRSGSLLSAMVLSILTVAAFFTKQYFLYIAFPVFLYEYTRDRKRAWVYGLGTVLIGGGAFCLVQRIFPSFFYEGLIAQANSSGTRGSWSYCAEQSIRFVEYYWPLLVLMGYSLSRSIKRQITGEQGGGREGESLSGYGFIFGAAVICLLYMGRNRGAWLSYYYQLALPSMIVLGLSAVPNCGRRMAQMAWVLVIIGVSLFHGHAVPFRPLLTTEERASWAQAQAILDGHGSGKMLLSPVFADYIGKNNIDIVDNGHTGYYQFLGLTKEPLSSRLLKWFSPEDRGFLGRFRGWEAGLSRAVQERKFSIIAVARKEHPLVSQQDLETYYLKINEVNLRIGQQLWPMEFWVPNIDPRTGKRVTAGAEEPYKWDTSECRSKDVRLSAALLGAATETDYRGLLQEIAGKCQPPHLPPIDFSQQTLAGLVFREDDGCYPLTVTIQVQRDDQAKTILYTEGVRGAKACESSVGYTMILWTLIPKQPGYAAAFQPESR